MNKRWISDRLNRVLRRFGAEIVPASVLYEWQQARIDNPGWSNSALPDDAARYLSPDNPRLIALQERYKAFDPVVTTPYLWTDNYVSAKEVAYFRGDNAWVWQVRGGRNTNVLSYAVTYYYLASIDRLGLFDRLVEDESFGNFIFTIAGRKISRDLLDSIAEIYFLERHLGISRAGLRVLDVGAGYGRLAHRMTTALPNVEYYVCTDAVAVSTFVSDYYLRFRGVDKAAVVPLDEIERTLGDRPVDLAINIHSFSECRTQAIEWWARLLAKHRVKHLLVVPNRAGGSGERLFTSDGHDFLPILERCGYRTVVKEPKFLDPVVQEYGLLPTWHHLLELQA